MPEEQTSQPATAPPPPTAGEFRDSVFRVTADPKCKKKDCFGRGVLHTSITSGGGKAMNFCSCARIEVAKDSQIAESVLQSHGEIMRLVGQVHAELYTRLVRHTFLGWSKWRLRQLLVNLRREIKPPQPQKGKRNQ